MSEVHATSYVQHRQDAIRAAAAVFAEKGYHGSSTRDIAERLGIKQGSLYYYFNSKEEALVEVCLYAMRDYAQHMDILQAINLQIYRRFGEEGIEFAYPTQTLFVEKP